MNQPLAYIDPSVTIHSSVTVSPFSTIYEDVEIGEGTWIGPNVTIFSGARIGKNCKIYPGAVISAIPQDLKYQGEDTQTYIGDNTIIRECVTINKGTADRGETRIGKNCLIMAYCHVAHDCLVGDNCIFSNNTALAGHVEVAEYVTLAGMTAVHQFTRIGRHAFVAGGTLIRKDIPPYVKVAKEPASYLGVNSVGLRRRGFSSEKVEEIQSIYRILFQEKHNTSQAVAKIEEEYSASPERDEILFFISNSTRGLIRGIN